MLTAYPFLQIIRTRLSHRHLNDVTQSFVTKRAWCMAPRIPYSEQDPVFVFLSNKELEIYFIPYILS